MGSKVSREFNGKNNLEEVSFEELSNKIKALESGSFYENDPELGSLSELFDVNSSNTRNQYISSSKDNVVPKLNLTKLDKQKAHRQTVVDEDYIYELTRKSFLTSQEQSNVVCFFENRKNEKSKNTGDNIYIISSFLGRDAIHENFANRLRKIKNEFVKERELKLAQEESFREILIKEIRSLLREKDLIGKRGHSKGRHVAAHMRTMQQQNGINR